VAACRRGLRIIASTEEWAAVLSEFGAGPASPSHLEDEQRTLAELSPPPPPLPDPAVDADDFELKARRGAAGSELGEEDGAESPVGSADAAAWFVRVLGQEFGPMSLSDLAAMAGNGGLGDQDQVRQGGAGEWVQAGSVPFLLAAIVLGKSHGGRPHRPRRASAAAADEEDFEIDVPLGAAPPVSDAAVPHAEPSSEARVPEPVAPAAVTRFPDVVEAEAARRRRASPWAPRGPLGGERTSARPRERRTVPAGAKFVVGLAAAVIVGTLAAYLAFAGLERAYYGVLDEVWRDLRGLRARSATEDEWSQFSAAAREKIQPIIKDLKRTAHADAPARQHLLWAAEDYLLPMLDDAREAPSESERRFAEHLAEARRWIGE
jgi:hypothetical protein